MDWAWVLGLAVVAPALAGAVTLWLPRGSHALRVWTAAAGPSAALALIGWYLADAGVAQAAGGEATGSIPLWPSLNLNLAFMVDGLGGFFALLIAAVGVLIVLYARAYFGPEEADLYRFYPTLGLFTTAMLGIVLADYTLLTLLFWEMTSISSFLLIGWDRFDKRAVKLAMQAFFTTGLGGLVMLGGVVLLGMETGTWRWSELVAGGALEASPGAIAAFLLILFGAATKSAQFPFHYWLPGAMAAPTPVSAFLHSATMVKAGVFLTGRMLPVFFALEVWPWVIIPVGAVTMLMGAYIALNQHDLKRIFAYTTVSQLGLLMCMYGLGGLSFAYGDERLALIDWDVSQIANHAFYKAPLFIIAGALGHVASRQLPELFGAVREHKAMVVVVLAAGYALAAGPGTISFQAKELFLYAIYHAADAVHPVFWVVLAMAVATAAFNAAIFIRLATTLLGLGPGLRPEAEADGSEHAGDTHMPDHPVHGAYPAHDAGEEPGEDHNHDHHEHHHETGFWGLMLWLPAALILLPQFVGGLWTPAWNAVFEHLEVHTNYFAAVPALWEVEFGVPLMGSIVAMVAGVALGLSPWMRGAIVDVHDRIYPAIYDLCVNGGGRAFRVVQTGHLMHYVVFTLGAMLIAVAGALWVEMRNGAEMAAVLWAELPLVLEFWPGLALAVIACATTVVLPIARTRVNRVLLLGACGFSVVGLYLVYEAPDLALTQLMFEIISVILFVLVLRLLPEAAAKHAWVGRYWRLGLSAAVGLAVGWLTLIAASQEPMTDLPVLGEFFLQHAYDGTDLTAGRGAGGGNVVNVVLVDFRGFDTLGEIVVLALAAVGVWSLIPRPRRRRKEAAA